MSEDTEHEWLACELCDGELPRLWPGLSDASISPLLQRGRARTTWCGMIAAPDRHHRDLAAVVESRQADSASIDGGRIGSNEYYRELRRN